VLQEARTFPGLYFLCGISVSSQIVPRAIEINGVESEWKKDRDIRPDARFATEGIRTLHISAQAIFRQPDLVVERVKAAIQAGKSG
jgi:very-short-patch-repair endonuclease